MSRFFDGVTTNVNGADFGVRQRTPGSSNNAFSVVSQFQPQNVNGLAIDAEVPQLRAGSDEGARAIDPTLVSTYNPNAISAPPTGNRAITVIDPAGGGNVVISDELLSTSRNGTAQFSITAYLQTTPTAFRAPREAPPTADGDRRSVCEGRSPRPRAWPSPTRMALGGRHLRLSPELDKARQ